MTTITSTTTHPSTPYQYPASPTLCAAIDREIMAEVMTCPACATAWGKYQLIQDCPQCGAMRDESWWGRIVRIATEGVKG